MSMRLDDEELDRLSGHGASALSHAAKVLYVLGIRQHMDMETGLTGYRRKVSYQSFAELLEFQPVRGSHRPQQRFNREALRALIRELERVGLVRWIRSDDRCLFFECPCATRDSSPKKRNNPRTTPSSHPMSNPTQPNSVAGLTGHEPPHEPPTPPDDEQPTSGLPVNTERERDAQARASGWIPGSLPACIPASAWRMYEDERNLATGRVMSINQRLALWQQLVTLDREGYDPEAVLLYCVAHGFARFERRPDLKRKPPGATNQQPGACASTSMPKRGNYERHEDFDNSAVAKVRRRAEARERERQAVESGNVIDVEFRRETP